MPVHLQYCQFLTNILFNLSWIILFPYFYCIMFLPESLVLAEYFSLFSISHLIIRIYFFVSIVYSEVCGISIKHSINPFSQLYSIDLFGNLYGICLVLWDRDKYGDVALFYVFLFRFYLGICSIFTLRIKII